MATKLVRIRIRKKILNSKDNIKTQIPGQQSQLNHMAEHLFPPVNESCELTIECNRSDYIASAIARSVEDAEAHLLNLNVTSSVASSPSRIKVDLRVSHRNAGSVARSLERYGFDVIEIRDGFDFDAELVRDRVNDLLTRIEI